MHQRLDAEIKAEHLRITSIQLLRPDLQRPRRNLQNRGPATWLSALCNYAAAMHLTLRSFKKLLITSGSRKQNGVNHVILFLFLNENVRVDVMFDSRTFQATFNAQWKRRNLMASRM